MVKSVPRIIHGAAGVGKLSEQLLSDSLALLEKHNVKILDTASNYPGSEAALGQHEAPKRFEIHTKAPGLKSNALSKQSILDGMEKSLKDLGVESVDLYYLHVPDVATPIEETLSTIQELYAAGKFQRFGLSNYSPDDVQKIYDIQTAANSVLPTVYQGNYNAVTRHPETELFPLLRKLHIDFYAYSPIAGGFLVKQSEQLRLGGVEGRFGEKTYVGDVYNALYCKESMYGALDEWGRIAEDAGISKAALAYRWITYHSALGERDGVIFGARTISQLEETLKVIEAGPLEAAVARKASDIWKMVEDDAPNDNWNDYLRGSSKQ